MVGVFYPTVVDFPAFRYPKLVVSISLEEAFLGERKAMSQLFSTRL